MKDREIIEEAFSTITRGLWKDNPRSGEINKTIFKLMKIVKNSSSVSNDVKEAAVFLALTASDKEEVMAVLLRTAYFAQAIFYTGFNVCSFDGAPTKEEKAKAMVNVIARGDVSPEEATCFFKEIF